MPGADSNFAPEASPFTDLLILGGGAAAQVFVGTTGQQVNVQVGSSATPDSSTNPAVKVVRTIAMPRASVSGDGGEQMAAILGISSGVASNQVQTVGVYGGALDAGTSNGGSGGVDAVGVYGIGDITGAGVGVGIGVVATGRRDTNTGKANGIQITSDNETATPGSFNSSGFSDTTGAWIVPIGASGSGVGIAFGSPANQQFAVGIGFTSQGTSGPIATASIQDNSSSATSILINGAHATAAVAVAAGSGFVLVGGVSRLVSPAIFEVQGSASASTDPLVSIGNTVGGFSQTIQIRNGSGVAKIGVAGGTNSLLTGTAGGDLAIWNTTGSKSICIGGGSVCIRVTNANVVQFPFGLGTTAITSGALSTVTPTSGTAFQTSTTRDTFLMQSCSFTPTAGAAATCVVALSPDNVTFSTLVTVTYPVGIVFDGAVPPIGFPVPAGWFVKFTTTNATLGTGTWY